MSVLILLIGISLVIALVFLLGFVWATKTKQYEDDYSPSVRILFEDQPIENQNKKEE